LAGGSANVGPKAFVDPWEVEKKPNPVIFPEITGVYEMSADNGPAEIIPHPKTAMSMSERMVMSPSCLQSSINSDSSDSGTIPELTGPILEAITLPPDITTLSRVFHVNQREEVYEEEACCASVSGNESVSIASISSAAATSERNTLTAGSSMVSSCSLPSHRGEG
jgi:hypothetical protein